MQAVPAALNVVPSAVAGYVPAAHVAMKAVAPVGLTAVTTALDVPPAQVEPVKH